MVLRDELCRILSAFDAQGIPVIVLKGAALLESIYTDISLRPMGDLDILVRPEHLDQAEAIALDRGYAYTVNREVQESFRRDRHQLPLLMHAKKSIALEIHQHIVDADDPIRFSLNGFWDRANTLAISNAHALALAPEDLLIHLSIKFLLDRQYHSNSALGQLCDISEVIKCYGDSLEWALVEKTAKENGILKGLHFVLYTCQQLLETPVPAALLDRIQPPGFNFESAAAFIRRRVVDNRPWLAHGLVDSKQPFSRRRMVQAIAGRVSHFATGIVKRNENGDGTEPSVKRARNLIPQLFRAVLKPAELKEDLQLDRWLHDLYNVNLK
jgi:hypothetical protein